MRKLTDLSDDEAVVIDLDTGTVLGTNLVLVPLKSLAVGQLQHITESDDAAHEAGIALGHQLLVADETLENVAPRPMVKNDEPLVVPATIKLLEVLREHFVVFDNFHPSYIDSLTLVDAATDSGITIQIVESAEAVE